ncbi:hypothetical protein MKZ24_21110 [Paenibacillus sp. FSL R7-0297]|uniref:hypothetical protein n=1 Tax=unclassified Paenibacillus TaxID=185978 RepID=UPI0004F75064|nr:hypothetical protein [Paenibacillus sp. FSL R5-0912]AIQ41623.1 hypothetical protein R50912_17440 [Paenibacillus sp. FSL R5-0912]
MKWKWIKLVSVMVFALVISAQPLSAAAKTQKVKVTFVSASLVENNHVGNEWWSGGYVDGEELAEGESVTINASSTGTIKLLAEAQEQDKIPEEGSATASIKVSTLKATQNKSLSVKVVENRGRYSGNTATWEFVFKLEKVKS